MIYFTLPTNKGVAELAAAQAARQIVPFTDIAIGDGNGAPVVPNAGQNGLVNEVYRAPLSRIFIDPENPAWIVFEAIVPKDVGGWTAREIALIGGRNPGLVMAVGNYPVTEKSTLADGSGRELVIRMYVAYANTAAVSLIVSSQVYATEPTILQQIAAHEAKADPHPQYMNTARQAGGWAEQFYYAFN